jgi:hypothetical protein
MYYTHWTPERIPFMIGIATTGSSLQIYSFKIQMKGENLNWPLYVYGVVAARDKVDRNRNLLFYRPRHDCQILTEDVCVIFNLLFISLLVACVIVVDDDGIPCRIRFCA